MAIKPGDKLKNGATVVAVSSPDPTFKDVVVLAIWHDLDYVTWRANVETGEAYWGHYFHIPSKDSFTKAAADFNERAGILTNAGS